MTRDRQRPDALTVAKNNLAAAEREANELTLFDYRKVSA